MNSNDGFVNINMADDNSMEVSPFMPQAYKEEGTVSPLRYVNEKIRQKISQEQK